MMMFCLKLGADILKLDSHVIYLCLKLGADILKLGFKHDKPCEFFLN